MPSMENQIDRWLRTPGTAFAVGVRGVIAEFPIDDPAPQVEQRGDTLACVSSTGAIAIALDREALLQLADRPTAIGHDAVSHSLTHRLTLPLSTARMSGRRGLTELGADGDAVQPSMRSERLFDMGLGIPHLEALVRTGDHALIATLSECIGDDVLAPDSRAMQAIKAGSPTRVFRSRIARIEVYQPIPSRARGERTPDGAHTHVLRKLLDPGEWNQDPATVLQIFQPVKSS